MSIGGPAETFFDVFHAELDKTFSYVGARWIAPGIPWRRGPRAPLLGEHTDEITAEIESDRSTSSSGNSISPGLRGNAGQQPLESRAVWRPPPTTDHSRLSGVRILDLSWLLASGGAGRFFTSLGAEVIRVEHESRLDGMRIRVA